MMINHPKILTHRSRALLPPLTWAPARADPDGWTVVIIAPASRMAGFRHTAGLSFSTMFKDHIQQNPLRILLIRYPSAGPVTFTPYSGTPNILKGGASCQPQFSGSCVRGRSGGPYQLACA